MSVKRYGDWPDPHPSVLHELREGKTGLGDRVSELASRVGSAGLELCVQATTRTITAVGSAIEFGREVFGPAPEQQAGSLAMAQTMETSLPPEPVANRASAA